MFEFRRTATFSSPPAIRAKLQAALYCARQNRIARTTALPDFLPNFTDVTDQPLDTFVWSAPITVSGIDAPVAITVSGGQYRINAGLGTTLPGTVSAGDTVAAGVQTSASNSAAANVTVTIGGASDTFTATTEVGGIGTMAIGTTFKVASTVAGGIGTMAIGTTLRVA